jgi:hypothetical protein
VNDFTSVPAENSRLFAWRVGQELAHHHHHFLIKDLMSFFGAKQKWAGQQSSLLRSKMTLAV